jgi:limonene-1,2-epoxide hydrolase
VGHTRAMSDHSSPSAVVDAFIAAVERKDLSGAGALLADDISYENMPMQPIVGRDATVSVLNSFLAPVAAVDWQIVRQLESGTVERGCVANERVDRFEYPKGWLELPVAGFFEVVDGRITLWRDYFDMNAYVTQRKTLTES